MLDFKALKKGNSSLDKLTKAIADTNKQVYANDDARFWQPETDKAGNGYAVIRFLDAPAVDGEDALPWVQFFTHGFQGAAGWYIENCPTSVNGKCPACEHNTKLWNSGIDANKDIVRKQKRKLVYISNILVVADAKHPENEGKVFLYRYGKKIFNKINEKLTPQFEDEEAINPFDFWKGANFKIKIRNVEGFRNYDKSEFDVISAVANGDDKAIEKLWKSAYSLKEFIAPNQFKSYEELTSQLSRALGSVGAARVAKPISDPTAQAPVMATAESVVLSGQAVDSDEGETDMDYFRQLAQE